MTMATKEKISDLRHRFFHSGAGGVILGASWPDFSLRAFLFPRGKSSLRKGRDLCAANDKKLIYGVDKPGNMEYNISCC